MKKILSLLLVFLVMASCATTPNNSNVIILAPQAPHPALITGAATVQKESGGFNIDTPVVITSAKIRDEILSNLKELKNSGFTIDVHDATVFGVNDEKAAIGLNIDAQYSIFHAKGWIYVQTKPILDVEHQTLAFSETTFDVKTKNVLVNVANWLLNSRIVDQINKVKFDLTGPINNQKDSFNKDFAMMPLSGVGYAHGNVTSVTITDYKIADSEILIRFKIIGTIDVRADVQK
jgi:Domain of unknown function (DUF4403)